jgi:hypothetical protein
MMRLLRRNWPEKNHLQGAEADESTRNVLLGKWKLRIEVMYRRCLSRWIKLFDSFNLTGTSGQLQADSLARIVTLAGSSHD